VRGLDLSDVPGDEGLADGLRAAFVEHHVLVFRDQELDRAAHKAVGALFGELHVHGAPR
jgi:taurine dioxygenase